MASSVKTYPDAYEDDAADQTITDLSGLPSIPSNAVLNSVILSFTCTRTHGRDDNEIRVKLGDTTHFYIQDLGENDSRTCDITSIVKNNGGTLSYTNGTTTLKLYGYHEFRLFYNANWDLTNIKITANYTIPTYTLTVTAGTGGTVSGGGTYEHGSSATIKATPNTGYKFVKWNDGNTSATRTITVTAAATYTATFEKLKFTVKWKNGDTVLETDTNVEYGTTPTYNGSTPTKASTAQYSYTFKGWSPSVGAITGDTTYTAQFTETVRKYTITVVSSNEQRGTATGGGTYEYGKTITLTATPKTGCKFSWWSKDDVIIEQNSATMTVTVVGDAEYEAVFHIISCTLRLTVQPSGAGETASDGIYYYGSTVEIIAAANDGYEFVKWSDGNTEEIREIVITEDVTYTAIFRLNKIYVGTSRPKAIYIGTTPVKAIYVGTTKVYEQ